MTARKRSSVAARKSARKTGARTRSSATASASKPKTKRRGGAKTSKTAPRRSSASRPRKVLARAAKGLSALKKRASEVSEAAVRAATGKPWRHWFALLDRAGARTMDHRSIVAILSKVRGVSGWWQQMITVAYERARGLRRKHETTSGFTANASKTVRAPVAMLYEAWADEEKQRSWLGSPAPQLRTARPERSLRLNWHDGSRVIVSFESKGDGKSQVAVSHEKLPNAGAVAKYKTFWKEALARLQGLLEPIPGTS